MRCFTEAREEEEWVGGWVGGWETYLVGLGGYVDDLASHPGEIILVQDVHHELGGGLGDHPEGQADFLAFSQGAGVGTQDPQLILVVQAVLCHIGGWVGGWVRRVFWPFRRVLG